jgi:glutathione S-transferase
MKLYGHPMSTCTRKVLTVLAEKGQEAEFVTVDLFTGAHKSPDFTRLQPFGQVPAFDDDGFILYESRAICRYLDAKLEGAPLSPASLQDRARMEQWISVETSNFTPHAMKLIYQLFFNKMQGKEPNQAIVEEGRKALSATLDILEAHLASSPFIVGDQFTLADIGFLPYIEYLFAAGEGAHFTSRPNAAAWWTRCSERPSWKKATGKA